MNLDQFQSALQDLSPEQFEHFVADALEASGRFSEVVLLGGAMDTGVDISAVEDYLPPNRRRTWYFQVKKTKLVGADIGGYMAAVQMRHPNAEIVLVVAGSVTHAARDLLQQRRIQLWDASTLATLATPQVIEKYFGLQGVASTQNSGVDLGLTRSDGHS